VSQTFLEPYKLEVTALSPLHIGSGMKLTRQADFLVQDGQLYVIAENKLTSWLIQQNNVEKLISLLVSDLATADKGIGSFLKANFKSDPTQISAYTLPCTFDPKEILSFIKTAGEQPYLPGTSIKGTLRSALLRGRMIDNGALLKQTEKLINEGVGGRKITTNSNEIEAAVFVPAAPKVSKRPNYDINRLLVIRDSISLVPNTLAVIQVKILSIQKDDTLGFKKKPFQEQEMILYVETIKPNTQWHHEIVWQTQLLTQPARMLGFQKIRDLFIFLPEYCRRTSVHLLSQERDFYRRHKQAELAAWFDEQLKKMETNGDIFILPLGWGSGYDAKTITDLLAQETFELVVTSFRNTAGLGKPGRNPGARWLGPLDSPKSRKVAVADGSLLPLGWVAMRLVPPENTQDWLAQAQQEIANQKPAPVSPPAQPASVSRPQAKSVAPAHNATPPQPEPPIVPEAKPIIRKFTKLPQPGDRFQATVMYVEDNGSVYLELPGLSPDDQALGVISPEHAFGKKYRETRSLICEVISIEQDPHQKNFWLVKCQVEK
jgi:CRISPR-associated protein Csm5